MVAATESTPPVSKPREKPGSKVGSTNSRSRTTPAQQAIIRTRYLVHGDGSTKIAKDLKIQTGAVETLVSRRGWAKMRAEIWAQRTAETEAAMKADVDRVMQEIAFDSEELAIASAGMARKAVKKSNGKQLSMVSSAMRNFVDIARRTRGLDSREGSVSQGSVNFFVLSAPPQRVEAAQSEMKRAEVVAPGASQIASPVVETQKATIDLPAACAIENQQSGFSAPSQ